MIEIDLAFNGKKTRVFAAGPVAWDTNLFPIDRIVIRSWFKGWVEIGTVVLNDQRYPKRPDRSSTITEIRKNYGPQQ